MSTTASLESKKDRSTSRFHVLVDLPGNNERRAEPCPVRVRRPADDHLHDMRFAEPSLLGRRRRKSMRKADEADVAAATRAG